MRLKFSAVALALALLLTSANARASDVVGESATGLWSVRFTPDAATSQLGKLSFVDRLLFEESSFTAEAFAMYGFAPSEWSVNGDGSISTSMTSHRQGTVTVTGRVSGENISGTLTWTRDNATLRFEFSGTRAVEKD